MVEGGKGKLPKYLKFEMQIPWYVIVKEKTMKMSGLFQVLRNIFLLLSHMKQQVFAVYWKHLFELFWWTLTFLKASMWNAWPATAETQQFAMAVVRLNMGQTEHSLMWEVISFVCQQRRLNRTALRQIISCEVRHSARRFDWVSKDSLTGTQLINLNAGWWFEPEAAPLTQNTAMINCHFVFPSLICRGVPSFQAGSMTPQQKAKEKPHMHPERNGSGKSKFFRIQRLELSQTTSRCLH